MNFSSIIFVFYFLPFVSILYFLIKGRVERNAALLLASLFFYAWGEGYLVALLLSSIGFNHWIAQKLGSLETHEQSGIFKRRWLAVGIAVNLGFLIVFKYLGLISELFAPFGITPINVHLPLGVSFFTFQAISMIIDVYRGAPPAKSVLKTGLFISMFPQLVAGPIVRFNDISGQIDKRSENFDRFAAGVKIFIIGLSQKILIADILSVPADAAFGAAPAELGASAAWFGLICFSLQIYYDFAGYSNMAIGLGRLFGFELPRNFAYPYSASSFREFWRRWHMTLSRWFRDYLYIPLGGSRFGTIKTYRNLLVVFILCGIWHGAAWTFALWGLWHGVFLILERILLPLPVPTFARRPLGMLYVGVFVSLGWVLFRADDLGHAVRYWQALFGGGAGAQPVLNLEPMVIIVFMIGLMLAWEGWGKIARAAASKFNGKGGAMIFSLSLWGSLLGLYILCFIVMASSTHKPFLYFRF